LDNATTLGTVAHGHAHEHAHEELGWWRKYVFSVDHKVIGIQYAVTGLTFLLFGFTLMMIMRWQLAYPGRPIPLIGTWFGQDKAPGGSCSLVYNQLGDARTIMVFRVRRWRSAVSEFVCRFRSP
jgi:cytochrome c oxidase subunit 1